MKKIKYKVFASRKKFNIVNWIKSTSNKTYENFCEFLSNRNVFPPDSEYWNKAIEFYNSTIKVEEPEPVQPEPEPEPVQPEPEPEPVQLEPEPEPVQLEPEPEPVQETKPKRRRRRKNAEEQKQE